MIVACLLDANIKSVDIDTIDYLVPNSSIDVKNYTNPRVFKDHQPSFDVFPRVIYNYRDGRDSVISAHRYWVKSQGYKNDRLQFLVDRQAQIFGFWHEHVEQALAYQSMFPDRILMLRFEDLKNDQAQKIEQLARFLGRNVSGSRIREIIAMTDINLQRRERDHADQDRRYIIDNGRMGGWVNEMSELELKMFEGMASRALKRLNYPLSSEIDNV
jgi:hypothetical protein